MFQFRRTMYQWDPKEGPLPQYQTEEFAEIVRKSRKILEKRSVSEIRKLQDALDLAIEKTSIDMHSFEPGQEIDFVTLNKTMSTVRNKRYFEPKKTKEKFTWAESYACLALGLTSQIALSDHTKDFRFSIFETSEQDLEKQYQSISINLLNEAVSIIQIADALFKESEAGKENAKKAKARQIQSEVKNKFKHRIKDTHPNKVNHAIWKFYGELSPEEQSVIGQIINLDISKMTDEEISVTKKESVEKFFYKINAEINNSD